MQGAVKRSADAPFTQEAKLSAKEPLAYVHRQAKWCVLRLVWHTEDLFAPWWWTIFMLSAHVSWRALRLEQGFSIMQRHAYRLVWHLMSIRLLSFAFVAAVTVAATVAATAADATTLHMVAMRDGVKLATDVTLPKGKGPWPVVLTRTPYGKESGVNFGSDRYRAEGYVYVAQDCRGRYASEGEYRPFEDDRNDGVDTVNWVAEQPWCNGKVGMSGASAMGITTMLCAIGNPENLTAAFVVVTPESLWDEATFIGGVFKDADTTGWLRSQDAGHLVEQRKASLEDTKQELLMDIVHHRQKIDIPIYHVGGWYDIFSVGTQGNFSFLQNHGHEGARGQQKLMMGPFGHGGMKGKLRYKGSGGILSALKDEIRWFDYHLKGIDNGIMDEPPVKFYQMASARKRALSKKNGWQTADNWPPENTQTRYFLHSRGALTQTATEATDAKTTYRFDPANPVETVGGANLRLPLGPMDQRAIGDRPDYLRFQTPVLEKDVTIRGTVWVDLFASTDAPDTDFMLKLVDVYPDGYEALLLDAPIRTRYREGRRPEQIKMMPPGKPTQMRVNLGSTANTFEAGHRIAVHISSSNAPRFEVNPNTGEPLGQNTLPPRVANNTIHHDTQHPTALVLPVIE